MCMFVCVCVRVCARMLPTTGAFFCVFFLVPLFFDVAGLELGTREVESGVVTLVTGRGNPRLGVLYEPRLEESSECGDSSSWQAFARSCSAPPRMPPVIMSWSR